MFFTETDMKIVEDLMFGMVAKERDAKSCPSDYIALDKVENMLKVRRTSRGNSTLSGCHPQESG